MPNAHDTNISNKLSEGQMSSFPVQYTQSVKKTTCSNAILPNKYELAPGHTMQFSFHADSISTNQGSHLAF